MGWAGAAFWRLGRLPPLFNLRKLFINTRHQRNNHKSRSACGFHPDWNCWCSSPSRHSCTLLRPAWRAPGTGHRSQGMSNLHQLGVWLFIYNWGILMTSCSHATRAGLIGISTPISPPTAPAWDSYKSKLITMVFWAWSPIVPGSLKSRWPNNQYVHRLSVFWRYADLV